MFLSGKRNIKHFRVLVLSFIKMSEYDPAIQLCLLKSRFLVLYSLFADKLYNHEYGEHRENLQGLLFLLKEKHGLSRDDEEEETQNTRDAKKGNNEFDLLNELNNHVVYSHRSAYAVNDVAKKIQGVKNVLLIRDLIKAYEFVLIPTECVSCHKV